MQKKINCVIPLGSDSKWHNNELRYCLRGLQQFSDVTDVWLIGECPEWYCGCHIPKKDTYTTTYNIWHKVLVAAQCPDISDDFLFINDDYFFLKPFKCADVPYEYTDVTGNTPYKKLLRHTLDVCEKSGLPSLNYDVHRPMIINKTQFIKTFQFFEWHLPIYDGMVMKSCYANLSGVKGQWCRDIKLTEGCDIPDVDMFSISDNFIMPSFKQFCMETWPVKSRWEK